MDRVNGGRGVRTTPLGLMALIVVVGTLVPTTLKARERFIPGAESEEHAMAAADCSLFRSIAKRTNVSVERERTRLREIREGLQFRRSVVERCGTESGLRGNPERWDNTTLAELCPAPFEQWLKLGHSYHAVLVDLNEKLAGLDTLRSYLGSSCGKLPSKVALND